MMEAVDEWIFSEQPLAGELLLWLIMEACGGDTVVHIHGRNKGVTVRPFLVTRSELVVVEGG